MSTEFEYEGIFEIHVPGDIKPRKASISVMASSDTDALIKAKELWAKLTKPISIAIREKVK